MLQSFSLALADHAGQESCNNQEHRRHEKAESGYAINCAQSIVEQMDHVAEKYGKLHLRKIIHTITSIGGRGTAWGRPPLCVSLGGGFDTLEEPNAHGNQTGGKHDRQQRIGDHDSPNLSHQRSKRINLR